MKRALTLFTALTLALALPTVAQGADGAPFGSPAGEDSLLGPRHLRVLAEFLELTPEQIAAATALAEALRADVQPLGEEIRDLRQQIRDELAGDAPDATAIGQAVIDAHTLGEEIGALRAAALDGFRALLTADQQLRFEAFQAAVRALLGARRGPGGGPEGDAPGRGRGRGPGG